MKKYLIFDTETTGFLENTLQPIDKQPHCIELFMLIADEEGNEIDTFQSLFKPPMSLPEEIIKITGITDAMLVDAPTFASMHVEMLRFMEDVDVLVGQNLMYDVNIIDFELKRINPTSSTIRNLFDRCLCTVEETEYLLGYRLNLTRLHEHLFGEAFSGAHRAEADVRATAKCFFELKKRDLI